ncbi:MAG: hypothetical protein ABEJ99_03440 [Candidatus Nanohaloarchaea archaeon]
MESQRQNGSVDQIDTITTAKTSYTDRAPNGYDLAEGEGVAVYDGGLLGVTGGETLKTSEVSDLQTSVGVTDAGNYGSAMSQMGEEEINMRLENAADGEPAMRVEDGVVKAASALEADESAEESGPRDMTSDVGIYGQGPFDEVF